MKKIIDFTPEILKSVYRFRQIISICTSFYMKIFAFCLHVCIFATATKINKT